MKFKLSEWASLAEIFGAVAIVVSLYFVSSELRDANRETRAATTQATLESAMAFNTEILRYADVWDAVLTNEDLSNDIDKRRAVILFNLMMTLNENRFEMSKAGYMEYPEGTLHGVINLQIYEAWKMSPGAAAHSTEFLEFVEKARIQGNTN